MTVHELKEALKEYPPDALVKVYSGDETSGEEWEQVEYLRFLAGVGGKAASLLIW